MPLPPGCPPNPNKNNAQPDDCKGQMSAGNIDQLMKIWEMHGDEHGEESTFLNHNNLYKTIDTTTIGDVPWQSFITTYDDEILQMGEVHSWMTAKHTVWFRNPCLLVHNILSNPDFKDTIDTSPYQEHDTNGNHRYHDFMSGNWAWRHANIITKDVTTYRSIFVPIILGSDKMTVSVATGHTEYWPVYLSNGNIHNNARWAHKNGLVLLGFLAIPKMSYRKFHRQLLHTSLAKILDPLKTGMTTPEVALCPDGHYQKVIYGLGPCIADYPEQALLACIVQGWCPKCTAPQNNLNQMEGITLRCQEHTELLVHGWGVVGDIVPFMNNFPRADINELISPDLLHQVIKGTFKDHLVTWVEKYLVLAHGRTQANEILDDIDRWLGRGFKQWTGDNSKGTYERYVPVEMLHTIHAFLEFCYIVHRDVIDTQSLSALEEALSRFYRYRIIFEKCGVSFGAPNGLCSSITESKHIKAVKQPCQMLLTNQRVDNIAACRADFASRGMLADTLISDVEEEGKNTGTKLKEKEDNDGGDVIRPSILAEVALAKLPTAIVMVDELAHSLNEPNFVNKLHLFTADQIHADSYFNMSPMDDSDDQPPEIDNLIMLYPSAVATYFAPSDLSDIGGMRSERIRTTPNWRKEGPHYDTVFVNTNLDEDGMHSLDIARIKQFFSFKCQGRLYPCAAVQWYSRCGNEPDEDTGMWIVEPDVYEEDAIVHSAHLIAVYGNNPLPKDIPLCYTLDLFHSYYVNKYIDHHAFEIAF
ncbi:hypothetical protein BU17DRAFT_77813 [Hysterangium stoloniferum]|nr:hypothetical protein BU17DRAFT_77813 [Hysterangium stoloniferum]